MVVQSGVEWIPPTWSVGLAKCEWKRDVIDWWISCGEWSKFPLSLRTWREVDCCVEPSRLLIDALRELISLIAELCFIVPETEVLNLTRDLLCMALRSNLISLSTCWRMRARDEWVIADQKDLGRGVSELTYR